MNVTCKKTFRPAKGEVILNTKAGYRLNEYWPVHMRTEWDVISSNTRGTVIRPLDYRAPYSMLHMSAERFRKYFSEEG